MVSYIFITFSSSFFGGFSVPLSTVYIIQHIALYVNRFRANVNVKYMCIYTARRRKVI
nr:MAG TPA: hypothetical protein [Caudoviricetes sp.]